ncbi:MAG TPA: phosphodiester glycosidase family protein, partial [Nocardioides sp.]|nr:phosphodiester glycosidase family protein [Nocardioides sp.]
AACLLAATGPALAGDPGPDRPSARERGGQGNRPDVPRTLHPEHSSGGEDGELAVPLPPWARREPTQTSRVSWQVAPGVRFTRWSQVDARGPITAHLLTVDPSTPGLRIDYASMGSVRRVAPLGDILARDRAVAGVNGDFYDIGHTGAPLGLGKDRQRGLLHAREQGWNNAFFINRNGRAGIGELPMQAKVLYHPRLDITNLNSPFVTPGGIGIYTPRWGRTAGYRVTQGQTKQVRAVTVVNGRVRTNRPRLSSDKPIEGLLFVGRGDGAALLRQLPVGSRVKVQWSLAGRPQMAITGNNFLVHEGIIRAVDDREMHPRTAVGVDSDTGEVLLLVVDGRQSDSRGYTMVELANLMIDLGADEAVNLDGGGSSTMIGKNRNGNVAVLNDPSDGHQRWVANGISVTYSPPS